MMTRNIPVPTDNRTLIFQSQFGKRKELGTFGGGAEKTWSFISISSTLRRKSASGITIRII
jgi:hypothetical protein